MGWYAVVRIRLEPSSCIRRFHRADSNCDPRSVVTVDGTLNREIHPLRNACATDSAVISLTDYTRNVRACAFLNSEINLRRRVIFESCDYQGSYFANASSFVLATDGDREERLLGYLPSPRSSLFSERLAEYG